MVAKGKEKFCRKVLVECDCWAHAIELCRFRGEPEVYLNFWLRGYCKMPLLERIKAVWQILRGNFYHFEEIVLKEEDARKLKDSLEELLSPGEG